MLISMVHPDTDKCTDFYEYLIMFSKEEEAELIKYSKKIDAPYAIVKVLERIIERGAAGLFIPLNLGKEQRLTIHHKTMTSLKELPRYKG